MSNKKSLDVYQGAKNTGIKLERQLNEMIQNVLNQKETIQYFNKQSLLAATKIKHLQEMVELLSIPLNFPTKNDLANAIKINIQTEEKVDLLDEKVMTLIKTVEELKQIVKQTYSSSQNMKLSPKDTKEAETQEEKKKKKLSFILESFNGSAVGKMVDR